MSSTHNKLCVLPREMRLQTDRILFLTGVPKGYVGQGTDVIILSECLGYGGFELLEQRFDSFAQANPAAVEIVSETDTRIDIDAAGQHAWFVVPAVLDLLAEAAASGHETPVTVTGAADPAELKIAKAMGERFGLTVDCDVSRDGVATFTASRIARSHDGLDPTFRLALAHGVNVDSDLWWRLYRLSNGALAADTPVSRRHAGPLIVTDDGKVIGRIDNDDDTDFSFIKKAVPAASSSETSQ